MSRSDVHTVCAYKGEASYFSASLGDQRVDDIAWTYQDPRHDALPVRDLVCCYAEHTDTVVDGERPDRPATEWSRPSS